MSVSRYQEMQVKQGEMLKRVLAASTKKLQNWKGIFYVEKWYLFPLYYRLLLIFLLISDRNTMEPMITKYISDIGKAQELAWDLLLRMEE